jgi:hypothetical protein
MMKPSLVILLVLVASMSQAVGRDTRDITAAISDLSAQDSPLKIFGQVIFHELNSGDKLSVGYDIDGEIRNVSLKPVIAFDVSVSLLPQYGGIGRDQEFVTDYIFGRDALEPGSKYSMSGLTPGGDTMPYQGETPVRAARAEARVLFVQFVDGSTFGKSAWGDNLGNERRAEIALYRSLLQAYEKDKASGLSSAITEGFAKPNITKGVNAALGGVQDELSSKGPEAAAEEIRGRLANAQSHETSLGPTK